MDVKKLGILFVVLSLSLFAFSGQSTKEVAKVKVKRGIANVVAPDGTSTELKKDMWVKEGSIIKTGEKSFVKLSFIDKSSMNVGPKSELKIEKFSKEDAGVINVLTGKIRSKVTKDYLKMDKDKSKLFVRSKSAVMGIRGTEFMFTANAKAGTSTAVLFEGSVVFNKLNKGDNIKNLEAIVNKGTPIKPGQFSVASQKMAKPTVAAKLSSKQLGSLAGNAEFKEVSPDAKNAKKIKSVVPPGLSGDAVMGGNEQLEAEIAKVVKVKVETKGGAEPEVAAAAVENAKGFANGDEVQPAAGSMVDIDSGVIIPPPADSVFDPNTGEFVSNSMGGIAPTGEYLPPEGMQITETGDMIKQTEAGETVKVVVEIKPPDEIKPLDEAPTVAYVPPAEDGPAPASDGTVVAGGDEPPPGEEAPLGDEPLLEGPAPAGDDDVLPPPPLPPGGSTSLQPPSLNDALTAPSPPPPTRTRVKINVNKQ